MSTSWQVNTLYYITLKYPLEHFVYSCIILFWRIFSSFKKSWHNLLDSEQVASDLKFTRSKIFFAKCGNRRITSSMIAFLLQVISNNKFLLASFNSDSEIYFQLFKKTREFSNSFVLTQFDELKWEVSWVWYDSLRQSPYFKSDVEHWKPWPSVSQFESQSYYFGSYFASSTIYDLGLISVS